MTEANPCPTCGYQIDRVERINAENARLRAAINEIAANRRSWPDLVEYTQAVLGHQQGADVKP